MKLDERKGLGRYTYTSLQDVLIYKEVVEVCRLYVINVKFEGGESGHRNC